MKAAHKSESVLAAAQAAFRAGDFGAAEAAIASFIGPKFSVPVEKLTIRRDRLSLNSVNGTFESAGKKLFFKFHMEEAEDEGGEYYRAALLERVGYPVEKPLYISQEKGEQFLIYPYIESERLADLCRRLEQLLPSPESAAVIRAQEELDRTCAALCLKTLKTGTPQQLDAEPVMQLFYRRLVTNGKPGGRQYSFYKGQDFIFPDDLTLPYDKLAALRWTINGLDYDMTLEEGFARARRLLAPGAMGSYPACTAHGDAHNGNVWANRKNGKIALSWFDPAFAGEYIPVLLAEVKPTFHNIFAHADWLYDSAEADKNLSVAAHIEDGRLVVTHDWKLPALREGFLKSKRDNFWKPVLAELRKRNQLPNNWQEYVRAALFCCPTLVMNLRAHAGTASNSHTPKTSLLGLSIAVMLAQAPAGGEDTVSEFFREIAP